MGKTKRAFADISEKEHNELKAKLALRGETITGWINKHVERVLKKRG